MPEPVVSVLTAAYAPGAAHLRDALRSLAAQATPWEWILQLDHEDAGEADLPEEALRDDRVRIEANGRRLGAEMTRNLGLRRARGTLVQNLDHDDFLLDGGLDAVAPRLLAAAEDVAFAFGDAVDVHDDGRREPNRDNALLRPGPIAPGRLFDLWERHGRVPLHNAGVLWRADVLRAHGGFQAVPGAGDTAAIMAVAEERTALYVGEPTIAYRRHGAQTTAGAEYRAERDRSWAVVRMRIRAMRRLRDTARAAAPAGRRVPDHADEEDRMTEGQRAGDVEPDEQHVQEADVAELAEEERLAGLQEDEPQSAGQTRDELPGLGRNTAQDIGGGGGTTGDPGRQDPITPGEGRR